MLALCDSDDMSPINNSNSNVYEDNSSNDESAPVIRNKKRVQQFSDSDTEKENVQSNNDETVQDVLQSNSDNEPESINIPLKSGFVKSRIKKGGSSSDSDASKGNETVKNVEQQIRMKNKRTKLKDKFKGFLSSRGKQTLQENIDMSDKQSSEGNHSEVSDPSDSEMSSIAKIKQKIKKSMASMSSICDPDTSDEEGQINKKHIPKQRKKKEPKSTKLTEPKPIRMSAKQAMENMQLIKSESNRMLREKTVSLPYHKPKALSLKDIMARRKPAVSSDGKALPIKMNEEQLKAYALQLEQRQKEMMELCKSESDEETPDAEEKGDEKQQEPEQLTDNNNIESNINAGKSKTVEYLENQTLDTVMDVNPLNSGLNQNESNADSGLIRNELDADSGLNQNELNAESELFKNDTDKTTKNPIETEKTINIKETNIEKEVEQPNVNLNTELEEDKNDSNTDLKLVYSESVEEDNIAKYNNEIVLGEDKIQNEITESEEEHLENHSEQQVSNVNTEPESQLISLHYIENNTEDLENKEKPDDSPDKMNITEENDFFSDDDVNMEDIDKIIEDAEIMKDDDNINSPMVVRDPQALNTKPKLMGSPGMVIDLDGGAFMPKKLSGVELLKERFTYFARLKTPEEIEREKEKKLKPGAQHIKLKHELEEKIAEQRSLEWAKRLEEEKQQHKEMESILDDDAEESFEKMEENDEKDEESEGEEEELEENDIDIKDKPKKANPMVDDEAEESECDENEGETEAIDDGPNEEIDDGDDENVDQEDGEEDESSDEESSESEEEEETSKPKKGRILKAFEDSDDEDTTTKQNKTETKVEKSNGTKDLNAVETNNEINDEDAVTSNEVQSTSQDDVIQLAQRHKSASEDLFTSQESTALNDKNKNGNTANDEVLGTQTFSILDSTSGINMELKSPSKLDALCMSQPYLDPSINAMVGGSQLPMTQSSQSQPIGEDILALCTGKFYDNEFVSQTEDPPYESMSQDLLLLNNDVNDTQSAKTATIDDEISKEPEKENVNIESKEPEEVNLPGKKPSADGNLLKSMLDEIDDHEFDTPKPNQFFTGGNTQKNENEQVLENTQMKKKFIIESDDETNITNVEAVQGKKKKLKKKKPEKRALHISDDEEDEEELEKEDEYLSDLEEETERLVEYDSEENEIEVKPDKPKKKRKVADFFEQEAELTSEDEWVGSGDEDEKGLDRMEREEGDDEVFHQGKLRRELGQIHMRDVLDQDKREVRMIQELLFEDGDLGDGHRQRKFRWRNAGEDDETGTVPNEFADTQEEEFESEEQWRKQRHEREVFLRQMQQEEESSPNVTVNRTTIIKANLSSKSMSTLLQEVNQSTGETTETAVIQEKKTTKDIPSPKRSFSILQQSYHGSLLTRGRGALARLAALATPLAADDDNAHKIGALKTGKRNFVFTAITPDDDVPKVTIKRKADVNLGTPKLMKKMKIEEKQCHSRGSLLDHINL